MTEQTTKKSIKKSAADRAKANADKQRRFRERQKDAGKKLVRGYVSPEDVKAICHDVMRHRIGLSYEAEAENVSADDLVSEVLNAVEIP